MSAEADKLLKQLQQFDLSDDESRLYLYILQQGNTTALKASKDLKIARTKIYRLIEKLTYKRLVTEVIHGYGTKFRAEAPERFLEILHDKEKELLLLKSTASTMINQLASLQSMLGDESKILHYRGADGLKQVTWNSTKVKGEFRIYEIDLMHAMVDYEFSEKVRREYAKNSRTRFFQLTNQSSFEDFTQVAAHVKQWEPRYIPRSVLDIKFEIQIYNDVYCMLDYTEDDVFIVEIYNQKLADMQKQIFDAVWKIAQPMKIISERGAATIQD